MVVVSIIKSNYDEDLFNDIKKSIELCGKIDITKSDNIIIKINLGEFRPPETGVITHPYFLNNLLKYLREKFKDINIFVIESDATASNADYYIKWFGFLPILNNWEAKWVNLSKTPKITKKISGRYFKKIIISNLFEENNFFISLSKLKTHSMTKISCALKNQFGCIPKKRKIIYHKKLDDVIVDSNMAMKPDLSIVDGIIGLGGVTGPSWGVPIKANVIFSGFDPVAVDAACAKFMGFSPYSVEHVKKAEASSIGKIDHNLVGDYNSFSKVDFRFSKINWYIYRLMIYLKSRA